MTNDAWSTLKRIKCFVLTLSVSQCFPPCTLNLLNTLMRNEETFQQSSASTDASIHYFSVDVRPKRTEICPFSNENVLAQCVVQSYQCLRGSSFLPGVFLPFVCVYLQKLEEVLKGLKNQLNVQVRKKWI